MSSMSSPRRTHSMPDAISVRGARQNNLKGIDVDLPLGSLIVVTGPSGSGKSSFAFDTVYAEGQRRYVETFSPYTRQFLDRMDKPRVEEIRGIPPAIALEQRNSVRTARSTVGTLTEINDYLKLLLPQTVCGYCPDCAREIRPETTASIVEQAITELAGRTVLVTFRVDIPADAVPSDFYSFLRQQGYLRVLSANRIVRTDEAPPRGALADLRIIQDRLTLQPGDPALRARIAEAAEAALRFGKGRLALIEFDDGKAGAKHPYSTGWHCAHCDVEIRAPSPALFSFNNPLGACPECRGFGRTLGLDLSKALPDRQLSIRAGVVRAFAGVQYRECQRDLLRCARRAEIDVDLPFEQLPRREQDWVLYGEGGPGADSEELWREGLWYGVRGFFDWLETKTYKMHVRVFLSRYRSAAECRACGGGRYQPETLRYKLPDATGAARTLPELMSMPADRLFALFQSLQLPSGNPRAALLRDQIVARLGYLIEVGLGYLTPDRTARTLSGGELQRVNLTSCLGAALVNTLFVLDEPTIGLHPRDTGRLVRVMKTLRDRGNTLLVVEHEDAVIRAADHLVDIGPGRGENGGRLVYSGPLKNAARTPGSLTADYLSGRKTVPVPAQRRTARAGCLVVEEASANNLRNVTARFPIGLFTCVTGVSGSGKSTLVHEVLHRNLARLRGEPLDDTPGPCRRVTGIGNLRSVVMVDQSPLSRTPRSTPALYTGIFDSIRELFAAQDDAVAAGFKPGDFSFNSGQGRCDRCGGAGFEKVEMQFLSDVHVRCPDCDGKRFLPSLLEVRVDGLSIHDVLELTVEGAIAFFRARPRGHTFLAPLQLLEEVGLGHLRLGQPLNTLSGGESQRLKLVGHLAGRAGAKGCDLLIFDEPTTGLHFDDVAQLVRVFHRLTEEGHTVVVIEHNIDVIKNADHVIDLGPEAGDAGGTIVVEGTPEDVAGHPHSHTAHWLRKALNTVANTRWISTEQNGACAALRAAEDNGVYHTLPRHGKARAISVHGAREHNLKNIDVRIPRDKLVVVTGLSGSGKSTLAFDILFAEGQRRFLDSMSPYARQFVEQMEKPDVDLVDGLPPSVAIEQRVTQGGGKSTIATVTEVYHFLRLLFSKLGTQHCPDCGVPVRQQSLAAIVTQISAASAKGRVRLLAPLVKARKGFHTEVAAWAGRQGFETLLVDGMFQPVKGFERLERFREHSIDVVVGEISSRNTVGVRDLAARALKIGKGTAKLLDSRNRLTVLSSERACPECGTAFEELDPRLFSFNSPHGWCGHCHGFGEIWEGSDDGVDPGASILESELREERARDSAGDVTARECPGCHGARLNTTALAVRLRGETIADFVQRSVAQCLVKVRKLAFQGRDAHIARDILPEIVQRLEFMGEVGLGYLTLHRSARTLSGGESQRIRLAAQLGSNLRGVLYVLDEPTIGLHPRDNQRLLDSLCRLRDKGNSLVIVEHDEETIARADHVLDLGPGAGGEGGEIVAAGTPAAIRRNKNSVTGCWLRAPLKHPMRGSRRSLHDAPGWLEVRGAAANNLRSIDVRLPTGRLTVITGVSGSGKSSLMRGVIGPAVQTALARGRRARDSGTSHPWTSVEGAARFEGVLEVDQSPIGKTSRSTPATYIKVFDDIRALYAQLPAARMRGYSASRFSFNTGGGRCEVCEGHGVIRLEMNFLPPSYMPCEECGGRRFNSQTLEVLYNDKSIGDVMDMTVAEARTFFDAQPRIARVLQLLCDTGLGYLRLGQPSPTLSGGEAQRIKLVSELARGAGRSERSLLRRGRATKSMLYLLEEPTIGLHMADVERLLLVLHSLVDEGGTVIVIEHNPAVIAEADYLLDIGPEAGAGGGRVVASGPPEKLARSRTSRTAPFLRDLLQP